MNTGNEHSTKEENENRKCFHIFLQADVALHSNFPGQLIGFCLPRITLLDFPGRNEYAAILPDLWYSSTIFFVLVFRAKNYSTDVPLPLRQLILCTFWMRLKTGAVPQPAGREPLEMFAFLLAML